MTDKKKKNQIQHNQTCTHRHPKLQAHPYDTTQTQPRRRLNFNYEHANDAIIEYFYAVSQSTLFQTNKQ